MKKYYLAALITALYVPIVTIASELYSPLKDLLKETFWHHWLGKSIVLVILFVVVSLIFSRVKETKKDEKYINWIIGINVLAILSVFGFFVFEYMEHL